MSAPMPPRAAPTSIGSRAAAPPPLVVVHTTRERARAMLRAAFPRRRARLVLTRTAEEFESIFRSSLVDAAVGDVAAAGDDRWRAAALGRHVPCVPLHSLCPPPAAE